MPVWLMRNLTKISVVLFVGLMFFAMGVFGKILLLGIVGVTLYGYLAAKGDKAGMGARGLAGAGAFIWHSLLSFGALLASTAWGRAVMAVGAILMLVDASWGMDSVGIPVIGTVGFFLLALVVGGTRWSKTRRYVARVEDTVRSAVKGHTRVHTPEIRFGSGSGFLSKLLGRYEGAGAFTFHVPPEMRGSKLVEAEQHLRERLPAAVDSSWTFEWDLKEGKCRAKVAPDLPTSVWHPYADGSFGNPLSPKGDALKIPLGLAMGGEQVVWTPKSNPHLLAVGTTGGGKSGVIRAVMEHLLLHQGSWLIRMIDPKFVEFSEYRRYPDAVDMVALELDESLDLMRSTHAEMVRRQRTLMSYEVQNIDELNLARKARGEKPLQRIMIVIDEVAELLDRSGGKSDEAKEQDEIRDEISAIFESIARLGRAMGVHMIYATQRNDAKLISGQVRNNTGARVAVGRLTPEGSRMALENELATGLPGLPGRGIFYDFGACREFQVYRTEMPQIRDMLGVEERG